MVLSLRESRMAWRNRAWTTFKHEGLFGAGFVLASLVAAAWACAHYRLELWQQLVPIMLEHGILFGAIVVVGVALATIPLVFAVAGSYPTWERHQRLVEFYQIYQQYQAAEAQS